MQKPFLTQISNTAQIHRLCTDLKKNNTTTTLKVNVALLRVHILLNGGRISPLHLLYNRCSACHCLAQGYKHSTT